MQIGISWVKWNDGYLDKGTTAVVNGLFIVLVFLSHFAQYAPEYIVNYIGRYLEQLIVVMFLFYSGYGCAVQYLKKGQDYLRSFPRKRILATLVNFDVAVLAFLVVGLLLGKVFTVKQVLLSFVCWESLGNSNWYIFAIMLCYATFWAVFSTVKTKYLAGGGVVVLGLGMMVVGLALVKPSYWYDTMMTFGAGVLYGLFREQVERFVRERYWGCLAAALGVFLATRYLPLPGRLHFATFNCQSIAFAALVVMGTMKVVVRCPALRWCGEHLFPLYIYQRIPMIVFSALHPAAFQDWRCWIYCALSAMIAVLVAAIYPKFQFR